MNTTNRNRTLWLLVALVSIHTIVTTAIFLATGSLPNGLMVFTLIVFGLTALAAIYFIANAPRRIQRIESREGRVVVEDRVQTDDVEPVVRLQVEQGPMPTHAGPDDEGTQPTF